MKHLKFAWLLLVLLTLAACGRDVAPDALEVRNAAAPSITSDKADYAPGELVTLTGSNWQPGESVQIVVDDDGIYEYRWQRDVTVTADDDGNIVDKFNLPDWFVADYFVGATGVSGKATTTFTDGNVAVETSGPTVDLNYRRFTGTGCSPNPGTQGPTTSVSSTSGSTTLFGQDTGSFRLEVPATVGNQVFSHWSAQSSFSSTANPLCFNAISGNRTFKANYVAAAATTTSVGSITASSSTFGGTTNLSATVSPAGAPGSVAFFVNGSTEAAAGTVSYNSSTGVATLSNYTHGLNARTTAYSVRAVFTSSNTSTHTSSNATNDAALAVGKANQTVSFADNTPANKTEGDPEFTVSASATSRLAVVFSAKAESKCSVSSAGVVSNLEKGTCTVVASQGGNDNYNAAANVEHVITVAAPPKQDQTINFNQPTTPAVYNSTFDVNPTASSGLTVTVTAAGGCTISSNKVTMTSGTDACILTASQAGDDKRYNAAPPIMRTVAAKKANQAISWDAPEAITYGTALGNNQLNASTNGGGALTYDPPAGRVLNAGPRTLKVDAAATANYEAASATVELTVNKAPLTVTASNQTVVYGTDPDDFTLSYNGFVNGEKEDVLSGDLSFTGAGKNVGTYTITPAGLTSNNYTISFVAGRLTITKATSTTTVTCTGTPTYTGSDQKPCSATATGAGGLSESVTVSYTNNTNAGTASASANYAGGQNHEPSSGSATFTIAKAATTTTVSCSTDPFTYNGSAQTPCSASVTGAGGLDETLTVSYEDNTNAGTATASASYAGSANHLGSSDRKTFTIDKATATVALSNLSYIFDGTAKSATVATNPSGLSVATTYSGSSNAPSAVGSYNVVATINNANYQGSASGTLTISAWTFTGFFQPIEMSRLNSVKAGSAVPVKFTLGGDRGLRIFDGTPRAQVMTCAGTVDPIAGDETVTAGSSSLSYDAATGQYNYVWKTDKAWAGGCRQLQVKFADGQTRTANFQFLR